MADSNGADREPLTRRELRAREAALLDVQESHGGAAASDGGVSSPSVPATPDGDPPPPPSRAVVPPVRVDDDETDGPAVDPAADDETDGPAVGPADLSFEDQVLGADHPREWTLHEPTDDDVEEDAPEAGGLRHRRPRDMVATLLGGVGELLVTAGVVLCLFVVWQIWWTDVKANQHTSEVIEAMALPEAPSGAILDTAKQLGPAPLPAMPEGAYAVLRVPAWGSDYMVPIEEGVGLEAVLHQGLAGHYPDTQGPGQLGNFALAGHRQSHGAIFLHVDQLQPGDAIIVETAETWYVYTVTDFAIVAPSEVEVISPVPGNPGAEPTEAMITLTTCHPLWSTAERYVVHGQLEYWAPHDAGTPAELEVS